MAAFFYPFRSDKQGGSFPLSNDDFTLTFQRQDVLTNDYLAKGGLTLSDIVTLTTRVNTGSTGGLLHLCLTVDPPPQELFPELTSKTASH